MRWLPIDKAMRRLTYADERRVLSAALLTPRTTPLLLVRHGKAMLRKDWSGPDQDRRLTARGRRQAASSPSCSAAYGVERWCRRRRRGARRRSPPYAKFAGLGGRHRGRADRGGGHRAPRRGDGLHRGPVPARRRAHGAVRAPAGAARHVQGPRPPIPADGGGRGDRGPPRRRRRQGGRRGPQAHRPGPSPSHRRYPIGTPRRIDHSAVHLPVHPTGLIALLRFFTVRCRNEPKHIEFRGRTQAPPPSRKALPE